MLDDSLNFKSLIDQRILHEAYCSKPLERKFNTSSSPSLNITNSINPNKASHFVSFFSKNKNSDQRFVTQREKRWKENRKNISLTLAQLHLEELEKSKVKQKSVKRKYKQSVVESKLLFIYALPII